MIRIIVISLVLIIANTHPVQANVFSVGDISINEPWARALPAVSKNGAAYFTLTNNGNHSDRLIAAKSSIARMSHIHTHKMEHGVAKMRQVPAVDLPSAKTITLKPGMGFHIMMMGLKEPLVAGKIFSMVLTFENAGDILVDVTVR